MTTKGIALYQYDALKRALKRKRFGLFFQQRVGKSRVAVYYIKAIFSRFKDIDKALIVSPLISRHVWSQEIRQLTDMNVVMINKPKDLEYKPNTIYLINYAKLLTYKDILYKSGFKIVIADEVHYVKNRTSKRSKIMGKLGAKAEWTLGLTGTPYSNESRSKEDTSFKDLFSIYRFIDPTVFGTKWRDFELRYCIKGGYMGCDIVGYRFKDELLAKVEESSMRVIREDVMAEPDKLDVVIEVELSQKARDMYRTFHKEAMLELSNEETCTAMFVTTHRLRLQQLCGGFAKLDDSSDYEIIHRDKLDHCVDIVTQCMEESKHVVVSCKYKAEVYELCRVLKASCITGDVSDKIRQKILEDFKTKGGILVVQERTVSVSLDLGYCNQVVFYSTGDDLITHSQIRDRFVGRGQKHSDVYYYYLLCTKTIDTKIYTALKNNIKKAEVYADFKKWIGGSD